MKRWIISTVTVAAVVAVATATVSFVAPLRNAEATPPDRSVPASEVASLVEEMAPGADVREQADGSVSVTGVLNARVQAEIARAHQLASEHPWIIQCASAASVSTCTPVADEEVPALVEAGAKGLHNRIIYRTAYEPAKGGLPLFDAGELVCRGTATLTCRRVDAAPPTIARSETLFVTYRPAQLSLDADGGLVMRVERAPVVPLRRTP